MTQRVIAVVAFIVLAPFVGAILDGVDRKLGARMQGRKGPSIFQPLFDVYKLLHKNTGVVNHVQEFMVVAYLLFMIFTGSMFFAGGDILLVFFALTLAGIFYVLSASCAYSPFSALGAQRELVQMMAYEPMVLLVGVGFYLATGSFKVDAIIRSDISSIVWLPGMFVAFLFVLIIKFRKSPFDYSTSHHAHQEMVKGVTTELSGHMYAYTEIADWYENVFLLGVVGLFVINSSPVSIPLAIAVSIVSYYVDTLVDNIFPRVKWDFLLVSSWLITLIAGGANLLIIILVK